MNEWKLEMLLENGYELEANDKWKSFIKDLLDDGEITKRQYDNWKHRFLTHEHIEYLCKIEELERQKMEAEEYIRNHVDDADEEFFKNHEYDWYMI